MPRVAPQLVRKARNIHALLPLLLPACRTIERSRVEFAWIRNELSNDFKVMKKACLQRYKLVPLQYILGTQPFGGLDIVCRPGVLIPRWETEEWVCELSARLIEEKASNPGLTVWDFCCGTGCIGLLLQSRLKCKLTAVDLSFKAMKTCADNAVRNNLAIPELIVADVLGTGKMELEIKGIHTSLLTCNPPYIPKSHFTASTSSSVKRYEPRLALIGDMEFYKNLILKWIHYTDSFVYEVGDQRQVDYVVNGIKSDPKERLKWCVGYKLDSAGHVRVVFGYKVGSFLSKALSGYGRLMHSPTGIVKQMI